MANVKFINFNSNKRTTESRQDASRLGEAGEQIASRWLTDKGYTIVDKNYRWRKHEIDLIAIDGNELVIVEVKTRSDTTFGLPEEAVDHKKRKTLINIANSYVLSHKWHGSTRFDIISIVMRNGQPDIRHIKNAFNVLNY